MKWLIYRKGISASCLPYKRTAPSWCKSTAEEVEASVCRLAKKGLTPSQIGVMLRDQKGIGQVKAVTGSKILRILKKNGRCCVFEVMVQDWLLLCPRICTSSSRRPSPSESTWSATERTVTPSSV